MAFRAGQIIDGYRIVSELGRGGNGIVFQAVSVSDGRKVAIKVPWLKRIRSSFSNLENFLRETSAISRLQHPNIAKQLRVGIYESKDDRGIREFPYFMMEYVSGTPATELRETSIRRIVEIMGKVCEAIHYAHCNRVIHCDLKPTNILIDTTGAPKILDFGLAKLLDEIQSASGIFEGTPSYAAPEQFEGKTDERTDIWTLGAILFDLLTGHPPFVAENWERLSQIQQLFASQEMVLKKPTPSLCKINPAIDSYLDKICLKAMQKEPATRYQSAEDFAAALKKWGRVNRDMWLTKSKHFTSYASLLPRFLRKSFTKKARFYLQTALSYATATTPLKENLLKLLNLEKKRNATIAELSLPSDMNAQQWNDLWQTIEAVRELGSDYLLPIVDVFVGLRQGEPPLQLLIAYSCPKGQNLREVMGNVDAKVALKLARAIAELEFYARGGLIIGLPTAREIFVDPLQMMVISSSIGKKRELSAFNLATLLYQMLTGRAFKGKINEERVPQKFQETLKSALVGNGGIKSAEDFINMLEYSQQAEKILNAGVLDRPFALPPGEYNLKNKLLIEKSGHLKVQSNTIFYIDPGVAIECHGQITAGGLWNAQTEQGDIWFLPVDIKKGWNGIRFFDDVLQDRLQHFEGCVFQGGRGTPDENGVVCGGAIHMQGGLLKIVGSRFQENKVDGDGGAVYLTCDGKNELEIELKHCVFVENQAGGRGGAIASHAFGEQRLLQCHFENNRAQEDGGGLYFRGQAEKKLKSYLQKCTFLENRARIAGGAFGNGSYSFIHSVNCDYRRNISADNGGALAFVGKEGVFDELHFHDCRFIGNHCEMQGGAVLIRSYGKMTFEDCRFENNRAEDSAGAVKIVGCDKKPISVGFYRTIFSENRCQGHGGGIQAKHTRLSLEDCVFERNRCREAGGAVQLRGNKTYSEAKFCNVKFSENRSRQAAGAVDFRSFIRAKLENCDFTSNCAEGKCGGALQIKGKQGKYPDEITLTKVAFVENSCQADGGALFADDYSLVLASDGSFEGNCAENGGAIAITGKDGKSPSKANLRQIVFKRNSCNANGGAVLASQHIRLIIDDCEFRDNEAKGNCGGIALVGTLNGGPSRAKLRHVSFIGNHCEIDAGAMAAGMHALSIFEQCVFENNWSKGSCGAMGLAGKDERGLSEATFRQVRFIANYCDIDGGAMVIGRYSRTKFEKCLWQENFAKKKTGGAILLLGKERRATLADFYDCEFVRNHCGANGGAINANLYSQSYFERCRFNDNQADAKNGGAIVLLGKARCYTKATFKEVVFAKNCCKISGGAINAKDYTRIFFSDCVFAENKALDKNGGAVLVLGNTGQAPSEIKFCRVQFKRNVCKGSGGAVNANIYTISSFLECRFDANVAEERGGAIFIRGLRKLPNKATIKKSYFVGNIAGDIGADVALKAVKGVDEQSLLYDNTIDIPAPDFLAEEIEE